MKVLYEDNHLIAVQKPHGMLVQGDDTGDPNLLDEVRKFIKERDQKPGNVFIGLLHRLDRPVGGVVLFAKTSKGAARLSEQFRLHSIHKVYWAVVAGARHAVPLRQDSFVQWLRKDERTNTVVAFDHEVSGSLKAELSYRMLSENLAEIKPKTGRPHQIRVAMSSLGMPIVGDVKYGSTTKVENGKALALFARSLSFDQPITKERITVTAEPELEIFLK